MKNASLKTLSIAIFIFTFYANYNYIYFFICHDHAFVTSNIVAIGQTVIAMLSIYIAFTHAKYFWLTCAVYFLSYPIHIFLISRWFPDYIYADKLGVNIDSIPAQILDIPVLLLIFCIVTYIFISRKENAI